MDSWDEEELQRNDEHEITTRIQNILAWHPRLIYMMFPDP